MKRRSYRPMRISRYFSSNVNRELLRFALTVRWQILISVVYRRLSSISQTHDDLQTQGKRWLKVFHSCRNTKSAFAAPLLSAILGLIMVPMSHRRHRRWQSL
ncbi:hypothetical protein MRB53_038889 [Persea americana]|nr:hypothetical protein MRB53_038889 [Persea americana]